MADDYLSSPQTGGVLPIGGQVSGNIEKVGDADWFAVDLTAGTAYKFYGYDVLSRGGTLLGVGISLYNPSGSILYSAGESDTISYTPTQSGRYFLSAKSLYAVGTYSSTGMGTYKLRATVATDDDFLGNAQTTGVLAVGGEVRGTIETASDKDWLAVDLVAYKSYRFDGYDVSSYGGTLSGLTLTLRNSYGLAVADGSIDDKISYMPTLSGRYYLSVASSLGLTGTYSVQALLIGPDDYADNARTAGVLEIGGRVQGVIGLPEDRDWFAVDLVAGQTYQFDGFDIHTGGGTLPDFGMRLYASGSSLPLAVGNEKINITPTASGRYYVAAESATLNDRGSYTLTATAVASDEYSADTKTTGVLPINGRTTGVVGISGDVDWFTVDLVAGTTYRFTGDGSGDGGGTLSNVVLALKDTAGAAVSGFNPTGGAGYTPAVSGRYFLAASGIGADTGTYTLMVSAYTPPTLSISAPAVAEGGGNLVYTVSLSSVSSSPVTFLVKTAGGTATPGVDYTAVEKTVTIAAGATSVTIAVPVLNDGKFEPDETVTLTLSQVTGALLPGNAADGVISATGTIQNDDFGAAFTLDAYRALNPDLVSVFGKNDQAYVSHYITNGKAEGRASAGFNAEAYAALNPDLFKIFGLNADALASHYRSNGKAEGRLADGFDADACAALNPDLFTAFGTNHTALISHYISNGHAEGRAAVGFDAEAYAALNPDLFRAFGLNASSLIDHYIHNGRAEGRPAEGFDAETYAALNPDLLAAFGLNHEALIAHYISSGRAEGRIAYMTDVGGTAQAMMGLVGVIDAAA